MVPYTVHRKIWGVGERGKIVGARVGACVCACVRARVCVRVHICMHMCARARICVCVQMRMFLRMRACVQVRATCAAASLDRKHRRPEPARAPLLLVAMGSVVLLVASIMTPVVRCTQIMHDAPRGFLYTSCACGM